MSKDTTLGALTQQPLHPRLAKVLRRIQAAERTATGAQRRPIFRLMREVLSAAIELGIPANHLAECLGSNISSVRNRAHGPDGTMGPELVRQLTDLTPDELDRLSRGELNRHRPTGTEGRTAPPTSSGPWSAPPAGPTDDHAARPIRVPSLMGVRGWIMPLSDFQVRPSIAVSDIQRAVAFYEGKLGLPALTSGPSAKIPDGSRTYGSGGGPALEVFQSVTAGKSSATLATWYVDDIDRVVDELTAAGVEFARYDEFEHDAKGITPRAGGGRIAWFRDPDGNTFAIEADV